MIVHASAEEKKRVFADRDWWRERMPTGWRMHGFTDRAAATFISPTGRLVDVDGELLAVLKSS